MPRITGLGSRTRRLPSAAWFGPPLEIRRGYSRSSFRCCTARWVVARPILRYAWDVADDVPFPIGPEDAGTIPLGRVGQPSEAASEAIVWLCSAAAS